MQTSLNVPDVDHAESDECQRVQVAACAAQCRHALQTMRLRPAMNIVDCSTKQAMWQS